EALAFESGEQSIHGALVEGDFPTDFRRPHLGGVVAERLEDGDGATHRLVPRHHTLTTLAPLPDSLRRHVLLSHGTLSFLSSAPGLKSDLAVVLRQAGALCRPRIAEGTRSRADCPTRGGVGASPILAMMTLRQGLAMIRPVLK